MPSTYTSNLRLTLQADGENPSTWGDIANAVFSLIESAIAGFQQITVSTGTVTLTTNNGATDQARQSMLSFVGALSGNVTIVIPNVSKFYIIQNGTTGAFTLTLQAGAATSTTTVPQNQNFIVFCDGNSNVSAVSSNAATLGGVSPSNFARLDVNQVNSFQSQNAWKPVTVAYASPLVYAFTAGNIFETTLTGATTLNTPTSPQDGQPFWILLTQDATGGRTVGFNSSWLFANGLTPQVDLTPNATTVIAGFYIAALAKFLVLSVYTGLNGTVVSGNVTITQNTVDFNLANQLGNPGSAVNVTVTVNQGVRVEASSPASYAMDTSGLTTGSVITLVNKGYILGRGGNAGSGGSCGGQGGSLTDNSGGTAGRNGGTAIQGPGSGVTLNINNGGGQIWGGGGGGGGGGVTGSGTAGMGNGGGGGGGAGLGIGGYGGAGEQASNSAPGTAGSDGTLASSGAGGAGGGGNQSGSGYTGQVGGSGGDWGTAGTAGTNGTATHGGAAGTAGKAVNVNSGTVSFTSGGTAPNVKGAVS